MGQARGRDKSGPYRFRFRFRFVQTDILSELDEKRADAMTTMWD
jgi:hypothetical protein